MSWRVFIVDVGADGDVVEGQATPELFSDNIKALSWIIRKIEGEGACGPHYVLREEGDGTVEATDAV
jgi:hypothetical protein